MTTLSKAHLEMSGWSEETYQEGGEAINLSRANSDVAFTGDLTGKGTAQWLLAYPADAPASFVGVQTFDGTLHDRQGTFVLHLQGTFAEGIAHVTWSVVPGSGTGQLTGLRGTGGYTAPLGTPAVEITLDHDFEG